MHPQFTQLLLSTEAWRPIIGFEGWYEVSNLGRVRRVKAGGGARQGRLVAQRSVNQEGNYLGVALWRHNVPTYRLVHVLVAEAFLPPRPTPLHEVNHKDSARTNNQAPNLEWVTRSENNLHAVRAGHWAHRPYHMGSKSPNAKLTEADVMAIRAAYTGKWGEQSQLGRQYGVAAANIWHIVHGKGWKHIQ